MKRIIIAAALVFVPFAATASQLPDYPFIHAGGTGSTYVMPDVGEVDFEISAHDPDPEAARKIVEARVAEVRALVGGLGLAEADVEIRDIRREMRKADPSQAWSCTTSNVACTSRSATCRSGSRWCRRC